MGHSAALQNRGIKVMTGCLAVIMGIVIFLSALGDMLISLSQNWQVVVVVLVVLCFVGMICGTEKSPRR